SAPARPPSRYGTTCPRGWGPRRPRTPPARARSRPRRGPPPARAPAGRCSAHVGRASVGPPDSEPPAGQPAPEQTGEEAGDGQGAEQPPAAAQAEGGDVGRRAGAVDDVDGQLQRQTGRGLHPGTGGEGG